MRIGAFDTAQRVLIVAEIGNNHEGDARVARELVQRAADAGADAVKFQTFRTEKFVSPRDEERFARMRRFELTYGEFAELADLARARGLLFLSTPLDLESADFVVRVADGVKVASGDNDFFPMLERLADSDKPVIVSSGASDLEHLRRTVTFLLSRRDGSGWLAVLHCVSSYPVPPEQAELRAIPVLAEALGCEIGYSDHTDGLEAAVLAVGLGATIVEKHFTLDKGYSDFRDHALSADPAELEELVRRIRAAEAMLGEPAVRIQPSEESAAVAIRRSIVAARDLQAGHRLELEDLTWLRPGGGVAPGDERLLVGRTLTRPVRMGDQLLPSNAE